MKFKVDENLPVDLTELFRTHGHDAMTVLDQDLGGTKDPALAAVCQQERRAIITLDTDFADIRTYPPKQYRGIVVFRLGSQTRDHILEVGGRFLTALGFQDLDGQLWIVDETQIRVRE